MADRWQTDELCCKMCITTQRSAVCLYSSFRNIDRLLPLLIFFFQILSGGFSDCASRIAFSFALVLVLAAKQPSRHQLWCWAVKSGHALSFSFTSWFNALEFRNQIEFSRETGAEAGTRPTRNRKLSLRHSLKSSEAEKKLGMEWQRCPIVVLLAVLVGERRNESKVLCTRYRTKISEKLARLHLA